MTGRVTAHDGFATPAIVVLLVAIALGLAATSRAADPTDSILTYGCDPPLPRSAANCSMWHTSAVTLRWTLVDPNFVPVAGSDCDTKTVSTDTAGMNVTCAVQNSANAQVQKTATLRVDQTAPAMNSPSPDRPPDHTGWWNRAVKWTFSGTDATSGIAGCDTVTYSAPDSAAGDVPGKCSDVAGNSATTHATVKYDATAPTVTSITPERAADKNGWFNHAVKWTLQGSDAMSGLASCDTVTYSGPDAASGTVNGDCRDVAGNAKSGSANIKYDATPPTVPAGTPDRSADSNGWWNHQLNIAFAATDATSGIAGCDTVSYSGPDKAGVSISGDCRDNAGNARTGQRQIDYDATPPTVSGATSARTADKNGWWNHAVDWTFHGNDALSGLASCATVTYSGPDASAGTVNGSCRDVAGNVKSGSTPIKYDGTAPTVTGATPSRQADKNGWWNRPVDWTFQGNDAMSGLAGCATVTYSGPDASAGTVNGSCTDLAGNAKSGSTTIKYDATAPTITSATPDRAPDHGVWWNRSVTVAFAGTDAPSGIDTCDTTTYSGPDGANVLVSGACRDKAGNAKPGQRQINYDATPPTVTAGAPQRAADSNGWWNRPVNIAFSGTDATSNIESCDTVTYPGPDTGGVSFTGACRDNAGNSATRRSDTIKYDSTPPTITEIAPDRPADHAGWWNHPVAVSFTGTDALSKIENCDTVIYDGPDNADAKVKGGCRDNAGNATIVDYGIKYDATPPTVSTVPAEVGSNQAVLHWKASADTVLTQVIRSPGIGGAPASTVYSGVGDTFTDPAVTNDVTYTYSINASDEAANIASATVTLTPRSGTPPAPDAAPTRAPQAAPTPAAQPAQPTLTATTNPPPQPPRLKWRRVKRADYYNFQLYRGNRKILSTWLKANHLQLRSSWTYNGRRYRLTPARYDWYVWPGFGRRSLKRYGHLLVHRKFTFNPGV